MRDLLNIEFERETSLGITMTVIVPLGIPINKGTLSSLYPEEEVIFKAIPDFTLKTSFREDLPGIALLCKSQHITLDGNLICQGRAYVPLSRVCTLHVSGQKFKLQIVVGHGTRRKKKK